MTIRTISRLFPNGYSLLAKFSGINITATGEITNVAGTTGTTGTKASNGGQGGAGGGALTMPTGGLLANSGLLLGANGGAGGAGYSTNIQYHGGTNGGAGGIGGLGATLSASGSIRNSGSLIGGFGGAGGEGGFGGIGGPDGAGGAGGAGAGGLVGSQAANLENTGTISGGSGGAAGSGGSELVGGSGGAGGAGVVLLSSHLLANQGTIAGGAGGSGGGEYSEYGGSGSQGGNGGDAVRLSRSSTINNAGTILGGAGGVGGGEGGLDSFSGNGGDGGGGVILLSGGAVTNSGTIQGGAGGDTGRYSGFYSGFGGSGGSAVFMEGSGTVINTGEILGGAGGKAYMINAGLQGEGVLLRAGGDVVNGSTANSAALISGFIGVDLYGAGTVSNFGTIEANGQYLLAPGFPVGVDLQSGGDLTNGSSGDHSALITGLYGVSGSSGSTIDNFGSIEGSSGHAVSLYGGRLIVESGSRINGATNGGGGVLELGAATGTIGGLGSTVTLSGGVSMAGSDFAAYAIDGGGHWTLTGTNSLAATQSLSIQSGALITLAAGAALTALGSSTISGTINGSGSITVANASVSGLTLGGADLMKVTGAVSQAGTVTLGDTAGELARIDISRTGAWTLAGGAISLGAANAGQIMNFGRLVSAAGAGTSVIGVATEDFGVIDVQSGSLDLQRAVSGSGVLQIDTHATLAFGSYAGSLLSIVFNGAGATLAIGLPAGFSATIGGFTASDTIDLLKKVATAASVNGADQLVIVNGSKTVAMLQLAGDYAGASFSVTSDGHGGSDIALSASAGAARSFASAMAGLVGNASTVATNHVHVPHGAHQGLFPANPGWRHI